MEAAETAYYQCESEHDNGSPFSMPSICDNKMGKERTKQTWPRVFSLNYRFYIQLFLRRGEGDLNLSFLCKRVRAQTIQTRLYPLLIGFQWSKKLLIVQYIVWKQKKRENGGGSVVRKLAKLFTKWILFRFFSVALWKSKLFVVSCKKCDFSRKIR